MNAELTRRINSVGKAAFVRYYHLFIDPNLSTQEVAKKMNAQEDWTFNSCMGRTSTAKRIIEDRDDKTVLEYIITSSRVDQETVDRASEILRQNKTNRERKTISLNELVSVCNEVADSLENELLSPKKAVDLAGSLRSAASMASESPVQIKLPSSRYEDIRGRARRQFALSGHNLSCGSYNEYFQHSWVDIPTHRLSSYDSWDIVVGRQSETLALLRIPTSYLLNNTEKLYVRQDNGYLSLHLDNNLRDKKGSGKIDFSSFLVP